MCHRFSRINSLNVGSMLKKSIPVLFLFLTSFLYAQENGGGEPIESIRFKGLKNVEVRDLTGIIRPYIGRTFSDDLLDEIQGKLYSLEKFELIIPQIERKDGVLRILFEVQERPLVKLILLKGNQRLSVSVIKDALTLKKGEFFSRRNLKRGDEEILKLYRDKGFLEASAEGSVSKRDIRRNEVEVSYRIVEGGETGVRQVLFTGNRLFSQSTLLSRIKTKPKTLIEKGIYEESKIEEDKKSIESFYRENGYLKAKVVDVKKTILRDPVKRQNSVILNFIIRENDQYTFAGVSFSGNKIYSEEELRSKIALKKGDIFNETQFQEDFQKITDLYYKNGYIFNQIEEKKKFDDLNKSVFVNVHIVERDKAYIEKITIRGNTKTEDQVILKKLPFAPGDVFSKQKLLNGYLNLTNTRFFSKVSPDPRPGSLPGLMDIIIDVEEQRTLNLQAGISASFTAKNPINLQISLTENNFLGKGFQFSGTGELGFDPLRVVLKSSFVHPYIYGKSGILKAEVGYNGIQRSTFQDLDGNGVIDPYSSNAAYLVNNKLVPDDYTMSYTDHGLYGSLGTGYTWYPWFGRIGVYGEFRAGLNYAVYDETTAYPFSEEIRANHNRWLYSDQLYLKFSLDTRDITFAPSRGFILSQDVTFAGIFPGERNYFIKTRSRLDAYLTFLDIPVTPKWSFRLILGLRTAFNALWDAPWAQYPVSIEKNGFVLDGIVRGIGWDYLSGGKYFWENTLKITFPIIPRLLAFDLRGDVLGFWNSDEALRETNVTNFLFDVGVAVNITYPQFPFYIYLIKKFTVDQAGVVNGAPETDLAAFPGWRLGLGFNIDIYGN